MTEIKAMELKKVDFIPDDTTPLRRTLLTFMKSDMDMAQVEWKYNYSNSASAVSSMRSAIETDKEMNNVISVCKRGEKVYLYRCGKEVIQ